MSDYADPETLARIEDEANLLRIRRAATRRVDAEERPPAEIPELRTLRDRLASPLDPVEWSIEGWFPIGGRVVMAAQAKAGKTTLTANLVRSLVDGSPWLGRDTVTKVSGRVAVLDFEMTQRQLDGWYRDIGIENTSGVLLLPMRGQAGSFDLRDPDLRARWAQLLSDESVEFIALDCLRPWMDALGLDVNHDAGVVLTAFDGLLADLGGAEAVVVHHMGHTNERAGGDSRIIGWGDANWKLVLGEDGNEAGPRWLTAYGRDVAQSETRLQLDPGTRRLTAVGGSRAAARSSAAAEAIQHVLETATEPMTAGAIEALVTAAGIPRKPARDALKQMVALNQITVELGERNARLHRWNQASSPVRRSSPQSASEQASQFAAVRSSGELASSGEQEETNQSAAGGLTPEQAAILARVDTRRAG